MSKRDTVIHAQTALSIVRTSIADLEKFDVAEDSYINGYRDGLKRAEEIFAPWLDGALDDATEAAERG